MERVSSEMLALSLHAAGRPVGEIALALEQDEGWVRSVLQEAGREEGQFAYRVGLRGQWETEVLLDEAYTHLLRLADMLADMLDDDPAHPRYVRCVEDLLDRIAANRGLTRRARPDMSWSSRMRLEGRLVG